MNSNSNMGGLNNRDIIGTQVRKATNIRKDSYNQMDYSDITHEVKRG